MAWAPDYITLQQARDYIDVPADVTVNDAVISAAITAASRAIDGHCNRQFGKVDAPEERFYRAVWRSDVGRWSVPVDDVMTTSGMGLEVGGEVGPPYVLYDRNAVTKGKPWTRLSVQGYGGAVPVCPDYEVAVTAVWGWTAVPAAVALACRMQVNRLDFRRLSPSGIAGSPDLGSELRLLAKVDPDVVVVLADYVRPRSMQ